MAWVEVILDGMWRGAVAVIPLAFLTAAICRGLKHRPAARHGLWLVAMLTLVVAPIVPSISRPAGDDIVDELGDPPIESMSGQDSNADRCMAVIEIPTTDTEADTDLRGENRSQLNKRLIARNSQKMEWLGRNEWLGCDEWGGHELSDDRLAYDPNLACTDTEIESVSPTAIDLADATQTQAELPKITSSLESKLAANASQDSLTTVGESTNSTVMKSVLIQALSKLVSAWRGWVDQLAAARDALGQISPIPVSLWIFGALLYAAIQFVGGVILARRICKADKASYDTRRLVQEVARLLELKHVPECVIVRRRVSPMIWCGWRRRLVLPAELWDELDADGRVAVVTHELAHLRRRDHWVRWIDAVVGCVYWWHPVVWWVRSRISAESENCCDAWVTWLNPKSRRAYAEALLAARQYVSSDVHAAPALGIGAGTRKSKNFARRLTMIMTRKDAPGLTVRDFGFALAVVCAGWLAIPSQSGAAQPPEADAAYAVIASEDGVITVGTDALVPKAIEEVAAAQHISADAHHAHAVGHAHAAGHGRASADSGHDLEHRLDRLEKQMSRLMELMESGRGQLRRGGIVTRPAAPTPATPRVPKSRAPRGIQSQNLAESYSGVVPRFPGGKQKKSYKLSAGKLKALTELMARNDVPILISAGDDKITVHGTAAEHKVFERFVQVISDESRKSVEIKGGKLEALSKLMIRDDVPVRVAPGSDQITVVGTPAEQQAVADFVKMINGEKVSWRSIYGNVLGQQQAAERNALAELEYFRHAGKAFESARQNQTAARKLMLQAERQNLREAAHRLRRQVESLEAQREQMQENADQMREEADRLRERLQRSQQSIEVLQDRANNSKSKPNPEVKERIAVAMDAIASLEEQLHLALAQADAHDVHGDALNSQIDELETQADEIEDREDELEDAAAQAESDWDESESVES